MPPLSLRRPLDVIVRVLLPACVGVYGLTLLLEGGQTVALVRSAAYLTTGMVATVLLFYAASRGTRGARETRAWWLLGLSVAAVVASDTLELVARSVAEHPGRFAPWWEAANLAAMLFYLMLFHLFGRMDRLRWAQHVAVALDIVALGAIAYVAIHYFAVSRMVRLKPEAVWGTHHGALYALFGLFSLGAVVVVWRGVHLREHRPWDTLVPSAIVVFSLGTLIWPFMRTSYPGPQDGIGGLPSMSYAVSFTLLALAAQLRLDAAGSPWIDPFRRRAGSRLLPVFFSSVVFLTVPFVGWAVLLSEAGSSQRLAYLIAATVATVAIMVRSAIGAAEENELRVLAHIDTVTGALNRAALRERCDLFAARSAVSERPFALVVIDLDGFSAAESAYGREGGERLLAAAARALQAAAPQDSVFRLIGDEFAVLLWDCDEQGAMMHAERLLNAVRGVPTVGRALSASAGVAVWPSHASDREELIAHANRAQVWAKFHGKDRVVLFDPSIVHALTIEERLRLHEETSRMDVVRALSAAADARYPSNYAHAHSVAALCLLLAEDISLPDDRMRRLEVAAMLHDVGKISAPEEVLARDHSSRSRERELRSHPLFGERLVEAVGFEGVESWVRSHHERWDGAGYPDGLAGDDIPLEARMIALADRYDNLTAGRDGAALSKAAALQEIDHGIGREFDPELAERFIAVVGTSAALGWSDRWPSE